MTFLKHTFYSYINGRYLRDGKISINDLGLLRGYGVSDSTRTYQGKLFHISQHLFRLRSSAKALGLKIKNSDEEIKKITYNLIRLNDIKEADVKYIVTGGISLDNFMPTKSSSFFIQVKPFYPFPQSYYSKGIDIITYTYERFLPKCKTLNYIPGISILHQAKEKKAKETLYLSNDGRILEGATSNFFAFRGNTLITAHRDILFGITRQVVLEIAKKHFSIEERDIKKEEIVSFDEAFITGNNKEIMPVICIDGEKIQDKKVGEKTKKLMHLFRSYTQKDPWPKLSLPF